MKCASCSLESGAFTLCGKCAASAPGAETVILQQLGPGRWTARVSWHPDAEAMGATREAAVRAVLVLARPKGE